MDILLIAPASGHWRRVARRPIVDGRTFRFSMLSLLSVAAATPPGHRVRILDEQVDAAPPDLSPDLVGITCMTAAAPRVYAIADRFRARGVPVVLGGMHPSFLPQEALRHADAVVQGEAEGVWERVVADAAAGRLHGIYAAERPVDLAQLRPLPRHLIERRWYARLHAIQATRGCIHRCAFCSVSAFHGGVQRRRPIADVAAEAAALRGRYLLFVDDNLVADPDYAGSLCDALAPLGKRWMTQATLAVAEDERLVRRMAAGGCLGIFAGLETFSSANLTGVEKTCNRVADYRERVRALHGHGIGVEAGIVLGFDGDDVSVFAETLERMDALEIDMAQISIFTPLPGTPQYERIKDRIFDPCWEHYDFHHAVFQPRRMTAAQLQSGHDWATCEFYRPARIARRLARVARWRHPGPALYLASALNLAYLGRVRSWGIRGRDPARAPAKDAEPCRAHPTMSGESRRTATAL